MRSVVHQRDCRVMCGGGIGGRGNTGLFGGIVMLAQWFTVVEQIFRFTEVTCSYEQSAMSTLSDWQ
jgi:uncharacterized membrane protein